MTLQSPWKKLALFDSVSKVDYTAIIGNARLICSTDMSITGNQDDV
jgi:hypothetical protein